MRTESGADHQVSESGGGHGQSVSDLDQRTRGWPSPTLLRSMDFTTTIGESRISMFGAWSSRDPDSHFRNVYLLYLTLRLSACCTDFTTVWKLMVTILISNQDSHFFMFDSCLTTIELWSLASGQPALDEHYCVCYMWNKLQCILEVKSLNPEYK